MSALLLPLINIPLAEPLQYYEDGDDFYITSAYCKHEDIYWFYYRQVTRGLSDTEFLYCESCLKPLFVSEQKRSAVSSTIVPEVVGWLKCTQKRTLDLVITESNFETVRDALLPDIRWHVSSKFFSAIRLFKTPFVSPLISDSHATRKAMSKMSLDTIHKPLSAKRKRELLKKSVQPKVVPQERSPFQISEELREKYRQQTLAFLKEENPPQSRRWRKKNLKTGSKDLKRSWKTSKDFQVKLPRSFSRWRRRVRGSM